MAVHRFEHEAMSTTFEIYIAGHEAEYAWQAAAEVFREIDRLEKLLSRFEPGSDVWQINRLRPGESVFVGLEVIECLQLAARVRHESGGAFDVAFSSRVEGKDGKPATTGMDWLVLLSDAREEASPATGFSIGIHPAAAEIPFSGAGIDLGGIGKGYALDKVASVFEDWEIESVLLNSGTSTVLALGSMSEDSSGWTLGVGGRWGEAAGLDRVVVTNRALSGSGTEVRGHHIFDPRTGFPATEHLAVWVAAPSAALSDALSTAFYVLPTEEIERYCAEHDDISAFVVSPVPNQPDEVRLFGSWPSASEA